MYNQNRLNKVFVGGLFIGFILGGAVIGVLVSQYLLQFIS
jgi:hypothetical protein